MNMNVLMTLNKVNNKNQPADSAKTSLKHLEHNPGRKLHVKIARQQIQPRTWCHILHKGCLGNPVTAASCEEGGGSGERTRHLLAWGEDWWKPMAVRCYRARQCDSNITTSFLTLLVSGCGQSKVSEMSVHTNDQVRLNRQPSSSLSAFLQETSCCWN